MTDVRDSIRLAAEPLRLVREQMEAVGEGVYELCIDSEQSDIDEAIAALERLDVAFKIRDQGAEISPTFPNGGKAPRVLTPRQIIYLHGLLHSPTPEQAIRMDLGARPRRKCGGESTSTGLRCKNLASQWVDEQHCISHLSEDAKVIHSEAQKRYEQVMASTFGANWWRGS